MKYKLTYRHQRPLVGKHKHQNTDSLYFLVKVLGAFHLKNNSVFPLAGKPKEDLRGLIFPFEYLADLASALTKEMGERNNEPHF